MPKEELNKKSELERLGWIIAAECRRQPTIGHMLSGERSKTMKDCSKCKAIEFCKEMREKVPCDWQMDKLKWRA